MSNTPTPIPAPEPAPVPAPKSDLPATFLSSLKKAMEFEKTPPTHPDPVVVALPQRSADSLTEVLRNMKKEPAPTPDPVPAVDPTPIAVVPAPEPEVKPVPIPEVRKIKLPDIPAVPPDAAPIAPIASDRLDLSGLDEDEVEEVERAQFAERAHPEKYVGHAQRVLGFIRKHKDFIGQMEAAGEDDIESTSKYKSFVKQNRPAISNAERRRLDQERIAEEVAQRTKAEVSREVSELRKQLIETRAAPIVQQAVNDFRQTVVSILPKEEDPLVQQTSERYAQHAVTAANEFLYLSNRLKPYDGNNPIHKNLGDFLEQQASVFIQSKDANLKRGNQTFVSRATYNTMASAERSKHFTFTDEDVLGILAVNAKQAAEHEVATERKRLEAAGYIRQDKKVAPVVAPRAQVEPPPSPRAGASPSLPTPTETTRKKDGLLAFMLEGSTNK